MNQSKPFAEIIESSLSGWLAQSWQWDDFPAFGSIVTLQQEKRTLVGLVHHTQTGSMDAVRYPFPYQKTEEELLAQQPQIFEFLKTTFSCLPLGYIEKEKVHYLLPSKPPKIHAFVTRAGVHLCTQFFANPLYLHLIFNASSTVHNVDELLLAVLKEFSTLNIFVDEIIESFVHTYSLLTGNDYRRLKIFLQRAQPILTA